MVARRPVPYFILRDMPIIGLHTFINQLIVSHIFNHPRLMMGQVKALPYYHIPRHSPHNHILNMLPFEHSFFPCKGGEFIL